MRSARYGRSPGRISRGLRLAALFAAASIATAPPARAAESGNPHGDLREKDCTLCHGGDAWKPAVISSKFDHGRYGFKLTGAHAAAPCRSCHASLEFKKAGTNCVDCHQDVHRGELGLDCALCHTTRNFIERAADVRRHRLTRFPLLGAHAVADCTQCHRPSASGQATYVNTPIDCEACHIDAFRSAKSPDHVAGNFSHDCSQCHSVTTWSDASFVHSSTSFPLTGAHRSLACTACHTGGVYTALPADCDSCHHAAWVATTTPAHAAAGFSTDCAGCHTARAWVPSSFNHSATGFPLTGAHHTLSCASCHAGGVFQGTPTACVSCHQAAYDATTNPAHAAAGFPTDCASCHGTSGWAGAKFNHDQTFFPIYSGRHAGLWSTCGTCHTNSSNYSVFTCLNCHPHSDKAQTDAHHQGRSGYVYDSQACYSCHPRGRAEN